MEKELRRLHSNAQANMPAKPPELFEPIELSPNLPLFDPAKRIEFADGSWHRETLIRWIERPSAPITWPTPECKAHCRKPLALLDEHEATEERLLAPYHRLGRIWNREHKKHWRLFKRIIRKRAETLQGAAAQLRVIELEGALTNSHGEGVNDHVMSVAGNIGRLVAALPT